MLIENSLDLIVAPDDVGVRFIGCEVEVYSLPDTPHLFEHSLNVVLF